MYDWMQAQNMSTVPLLAYAAMQAYIDISSWQKYAQ